MAEDWRTPDVEALFNAVLRLEINHPFANHLYIHAVEASQHPERAVPAADRLRDLQPGLAHNVHMLSHIDIRVGDPSFDDEAANSLAALKQGNAPTRLLVLTQPS